MHIHIEYEILWKYPEMYTHNLSTQRQVLAVNVLLWNQNFFFFFWPHHIACGILVPQPGIDPGPQQWKHRTLTPDNQGISS